MIAPSAHSRRTRFKPSPTRPEYEDADGRRPRSPLPRPVQGYPPSRVPSHRSRSFTQAILPTRQSPSASYRERTPERVPTHMPSYRDDHASPPPRVPSSLPRRAFKRTSTMARRAQVLTRRVYARRSMEQQHSPHYGPQAHQRQCHRQDYRTRRAQVCFAFFLLVWCLITSTVTPSNSEDGYRTRRLVVSSYDSRRYSSISSNNSQDEGDSSFNDQAEVEAALSDINTEGPESMDDCRTHDTFSSSGERI